MHCQEELKVEAEAVFWRSGEAVEFGVGKLQGFRVMHEAVNAVRVVYGKCSDGVNSIWQCAETQNSGVLSAPAGERGCIDRPEVPVKRRQQWKRTLKTKVPRKKAKRANVAFFGVRS